MQRWQILGEECPVCFRCGLGLCWPQKRPAVAFPAVNMDRVPDAPVKPQMRELKVLGATLLRQFDEAPDIAEVELVMARLGHCDLKQLWRAIHNLPAHMKDGNENG